MSISINMLRKKLAESIDNIYLREAELVSLDIFSFCPALRFVEDFSESESELAEFRKFVISSIKSRISPDLAFSEWLEEKKRESRKRYLSTGCIEDDEFLSFRHRYSKMENKTPDVLNAIKKPYLEEIASLWFAEVEIHSQAVRMPPRNGKYQGAEDICYRVFSELGSDFLIERLKKYEPTAQPIYGKAINDEYLLGVLLDGRLLAQPSNPSLSLSIRLIDKSEKKVKPEFGITFGFEFFFPIREYPLGVSCYRYFKNEHELSALLVIYIKLFEKVFAQFKRVFNEDMQ